MTRVAVGSHPRDPLSLPDDGISYHARAVRAAGTLRVAYSPRLGNFPVGKAVTDAVAGAVAAISGHGFPVAGHPVARCRRRPGRP
jgi:hypothetical protein